MANRDFRTAARSALERPAIERIMVRLPKTLVCDENIFTHAEQERIKADLADTKRALNMSDSRHI